MKLVKFTLTDSNGPVYVNPRQVLSVKSVNAFGTTRVTMRDGWLMHVHGDAAAVEQALEAVKRLSHDDPGPDTVTFTCVARDTATDARPPDRPWRAIAYITREVAVADVLFVSGARLPMVTESVLYLAGRPGPLGLVAPLELAEPPDVVSARLEGRT